MTLLLAQLAQEATSICIVAQALLLVRTAVPMADNMKLQTHMTPMTTITTTVMANDVIKSQYTRQNESAQALLNSPFPDCRLVFEVDIDALVLPNG